MNTPPSLLFLLVALFTCSVGCQSTSTENGTEAAYATYEPTMGTLRIVSDVDNPEITSIKLLNDKKKDSLGTAMSQNGKFTLTVNHLPMQEVYFLVINGTSTRSGTSGLGWTEYVPVYLEKSNAHLTLGHRFFDHPGAISKAKFSIQGGSDEQELLNDWQEALNDQQADAEGRAVQYTFGSGMADHEQGDTASQGMDITQRFIRQKRPLAVSLFLAYTTNTHRRHMTAYKELYHAVPDQARQTKYGIDLIQRLDRITNPIQQLHPTTQIIAVDEGLKRVSWSDFDAYNYLLLCFWNSMDKAAHADIKRIEAQATAFKPQETALIHLSVDSRFSQWKKMSPSLNLRYNYKLRNEVQQPLIDSLYLTELPRYVLIQPDGKVVDAAVSPETLNRLFKTE
ncbi:thioredoxin-like domain-containing protein [Parapedobacter koreensis]|uniref:AhpC/TSA family protein n=1 Tax=Parapedobacter koreensis TaxID=332977 RepID=A0A1H7T828_9SPHI|nr:thioredoxin-like domain-containing protein [Parapedobacter koreensis]SEL81052.1 AhpC/TSA family protein [Parapedobacter koreensis]